MCSVVAQETPGRGNVTRRVPRHLRTYYMKVVFEKYLPFYTYYYKWEEPTLCDLSWAIGRNTDWQRPHSALVRRV
jgi:hypothetical protein